MSTNSINSFQFFRGFNNSDDQALHVDIPNDTAVDIVAARQQVADWIDQEMINSSSGIKMIIESCASRRLNYPLDNSTFIREQHPFFLELVNVILDKEESQMGDALLFAYYGLHLIDTLYDGPYWVLDTLRELN